MKKKEYQEKHRKVIQLANAYRDEYLCIPSIKRWMESADPMEKSQFIGMVYSMHTAAAELEWIRQNDLIWIPDPDPKKDIHMQKGNVIRMLKYFAQNYYRIEMESIGTHGLIEQCALINSAIHEDDPNDRVWDEYRRIIAPKEKHDPDPEYLRPFVMQKYHQKFDGLSARIRQIQDAGTNEITMARIAYAMHERGMAKKQSWAKWYERFCTAFAIDMNDRYCDNPKDLIKPESAYQKVIDEIYSYLPDRDAGADAMQHLAKHTKRQIETYADPTEEDRQDEIFDSNRLTEEYLNGGDY